MGGQILEARALSRRFQGFHAVKDVNLAIRQGTIHALIGPNGAGKTTVFNLLSRFLPASEGSIFYNDKDITRERPARVARSGLVRSFQISTVFSHLSVRDNVRLALQRRLGTSFHFWRSGQSLNVLNEKAEELATLVGLEEVLARPAGSLSYGRKRALEIAGTLALEPVVLLLDEPMAGLGIEDVVRIRELIRQVARSCTILMVEHNLSVVAELSDTITVMARGQVIAEGTYQDVSSDKGVREAYLGN